MVYNPAHHDRPRVCHNAVYRKPSPPSSPPPLTLPTAPADLLAGYFGRAINVEYKDKAQQDPVTAADKETQAYLERRIRQQFPTHGILGEEGESAADADTPAADFLWVLDPLDGTTNFMNRLPVYASSIGVLHRGFPVAGAVYIPWPTKSGNGIVVHCRAGGGAFANGAPISVYQTDKLRGDRLVGLPGSFGATTRVGKGLKGQPLGQLRVTGSIAYELAMTAMGVMQLPLLARPACGICWAAPSPCRRRAAP